MGKNDGFLSKYFWFQRNWIRKLTYILWLVERYFYVPGSCSLYDDNEKELTRWESIKDRISTRFLCWRFDLESYDNNR